MQLVTFFQTHADTEVLLHGYEEWGTELLQKIRGMFAFAIWDNEKNELFGARDHFGIKPYYYAEMNGTFMFGSEIKSFLPHPDFNKELNKEALKPYMTFQYSPLNGETFFSKVSIVCLKAIIIRIKTENWTFNNIGMQILKQKKRIPDKNGSKKSTKLFKLLLKHTQSAM